MLQPRPTPCSWAKASHKVRPNAGCGRRVWRRWCGGRRSSGHRRRGNRRGSPCVAAAVVAEEEQFVRGSEARHVFEARLQTPAVLDKRRGVPEEGSDVRWFRLGGRDRHRFEERWRGSWNACVVAGRQDRSGTAGQQQFKETAAAEATCGCQWPECVAARIGRRRRNRIPGVPLHESIIVGARREMVARACWRERR